MGTKNLGSRHSASQARRTKFTGRFYSVDGFGNSKPLTGERERLGFRANSRSIVLGTANQSQLVFPQQRRTYLLFQNRSASSIFFNYGSHASITEGFEIPSGGSYEIDSNVPSDDIYIMPTITGQRLNTTVS